MKKLFRFTAVATTTLLTSALLTSVYATNSPDSGLVYAAAVDGCSVVHQITLDEKATKAYREIKSLEQKIDAIHSPLRGVEKTLAEYGVEMEQISELAIQDNEQTLYIDKELLRQQESIADKMSALVAMHQADFDAIGEIGDKISRQADEFSAPIEEAFDGLEYDQVKVFSEGESPLPEQCGDASRM